MSSIDALPQVLVGRYEVGALIGRGGMSEVCRARDTKLGRDVAIKVLRSDVALRDDARQRFEVEAQAAAVVNHPNVVSVLDIADHDGVPFIVLECLPGRSLAEDLAGGALSSDRVRKVALDVLAGLAAAHRLGVLHRYVKPSNILLTEDGTAKLADFGIAKVADGMDLTETGAVLGTLQYMAPERLAGAPASPASDTYGLGIVLYEALTGEPPFGPGPPAMLTYAIVNHDLQPVTLGRPDVTARLAGVVDRAVRKDPAERFSSAEEMAEALTGTGERGPNAVVDAPTASGALTDTSPRAFGEAPTVAAMASTEVHMGAIARPDTSFEPSPQPHPAGRPPLTPRGVALLIVMLLGLVLALVAVAALAASRSNDPSPVTTPSTAPSTVPSVPSSVVVPPTTAATSSAPPTSAAPAAPSNPGKGADKPGRGERGKD